MTKLTNTIIKIAIYAVGAFLITVIAAPVSLSIIDLLFHGSVAFGPMAYVGAHENIVQGIVDCNVKYFLEGNL